MRIFPERLRRKIYVERSVIALIRLTYAIVLAQAVSLTVSSCRNLNSPVGRLDTTSSIVQVRGNVEAVIVGEVAGYDVGGENFVAEFFARVLENVTAKPKDEPRRFRSGGRRPSRAVLVHGSLGRIDLSEGLGSPGTYSATRGGYAPSTHTLVPNQVLTLLKSVDIEAAAPGDVVTYTISFTNSGADSLQNIVISDLMSPFVDPMPDAFGPGQDVEWVRGGFPTFYLTLDPADGDECEYDAGTRLLQVLFSKNSPFFLPPGAGGTINYKVIVR